MKKRLDPLALSLSALPAADAPPRVAAGATRGEPRFGLPGLPAGGGFPALRAPTSDVPPHGRSRRRAPVRSPAARKSRTEPPGLRAREPAEPGLPPDHRAPLLVRSRDQDNLVAPVAVSSLLHALVALSFLLRLAPHLQEPAPPAEVALVWQPNPSRKLSLPHPGTFKNAPPAEARRSSRGRVLPAAPPPSPAQLPSETVPAPTQPETGTSQLSAQKAAKGELAEAAKKAPPSPKHPSRTKEAQRAAPSSPSLASPSLDRAFANLTNLNLAVPPSPATSTPGEHAAEMPGPAPPGHASMGSSVDSLDAPNASPDWEAEMRAWVEARDYYPQAAVVKHEEGISTVEITIDKTGKVTDLQLVGMSGSDRLDDAWLSVFRNRTVPAPTPDMDADNGYTFRATLQYVLIEQAAQ